MITPAGSSYTIRVQGHLPEEWGECFSGMAITHLEHGETQLSGPVADQAALRGILDRIQDLGLTLLFLNRD